MLLFVIASIIGLFVAELALGWLWYGVLFKKQYDMGSSNEMKEGMKKAMKRQYMAWLYYAIWVTLLVLFAPKNFLTVVVLFLFLIIFFLQAYERNIWMFMMPAEVREKESKMKMWGIPLDVLFSALSYVVMVIVSLVFKAWFMMK